TLRLRALPAFSCYSDSKKLLKTQCWYCTGVKLLEQCFFCLSFCVGGGCSRSVFCLDTLPCHYFGYCFVVYVVVIAVLPVGSMHYIGLCCSNVTISKFSPQGLFGSLFKDCILWRTAIVLPYCTTTSLLQHGRRKISKNTKLCFAGLLQNNEILGKQQTPLPC
ncbi:hypothetical protein BX070DRAFT_228953, partial [Coemansia spiralis]